MQPWKAAASALGTAALIFTFAVVLQPTAATAAVPASCAKPATAPFRPKLADVQGVRAGIRVLAVARERNGAPGTPPVADARDFAWDAPGAKPGGSKGNVMIDAHTYPNGAALGNVLQKKLRVNNIVILRGSATQRVCYKIYKRVHVRTGTPAPGFHDARLATKLVIVVCSGKRLGPGRWTHRDIWYGQPLP